RVGGCLPGRGQGVLVPAQAIAQASAGGIHHVQGDALAQGGRGVQGVLNELLGVLFVTAHGGQPRLGDRRQRVLTAGHLGYPVALRDQGRGGGQVTAVDIEDGAAGQREGKQAEGSGLADDVQVPPAQDVPVHVVPQVDGRDGRDPRAVEGLVQGEVFAAERLHGAVQQGGRRRVPVGVQHRHPLEQQVGLVRRLRRGR